MRGILIIAASLALMGCVQPQDALAQRPGPASDVPPLELGLRLLKSGEPTLALSAFNRALSAFNRALGKGDVTAEALTGVAVALHRLGRRKESVRFLKSAVDIDPNFAIARNNLGVLLYELGDISGAVSEFEIAYALSDGLNRDISTNLGIAETVTAQTDVETIVTEDNVTFDVIRFGHGVFRLTPRDIVGEEDPT